MGHILHSQTFPLYPLDNPTIIIYNLIININICIGTTTTTNTTATERRAIKMRFKQKPLPNDGDTRIKTKFLLFPKKINGETRWLEKSSWEEVCEIYDNSPYYMDIISWDAFRWID